MRSRHVETNIHRTDLVREVKRSEKEETRTTPVAPTTSIVSLFENVLTLEEADNLLSQLSQELPFKTETDNFGLQSRATCYFGDSSDCIFAYVGLTLIPLPWTPTLRRLRDLVTQACDLDDTVTLTACLINYYPQNEGYIPWHYDEIRAHGESRTVASLSLGGPRPFLLRRRKYGHHPSNTNTEDDNTTDNEVMVANIMLPSGSVLLMQGNTQEEYEHCLPLLEEHQEESPPRISLTFRSIVPGWESNQEIPTDTCCTEPPHHDIVPPNKTVGGT